MTDAGFAARLVESRELTPEVRHFVFDVPGTETLNYVPGQFVSFSHLIDGREITRAYSISSAPDGNRFTLCLNRVEDGLFSPYLFAMKPGDAVTMQGPLGMFVWRNPGKDAILVATGTGIAPFRAMLEEELRSARTNSLRLIFGVRYESHLLYRDELEAWARLHPRFVFQPTLTRPDAIWTGSTGRVQQHVLDAVGDRRDIDVYICGMKEMVDDVRQRLRNIGVERRSIIYEKYD